MKSMKKALVACALSTVLCVTALVGTTFAWFTDSITNKGNKIQSGTLNIEATAFDLGAGGTSVTISGVNDGNPFTFEAAGSDLRTSEEAIIDESGWEPGMTSAKLLEVRNEGSLAAKVKLDFTIGGELTDALWYDFIQVEDGAVTGSFTQRDMATLPELAETVTFTLAPKDAVSGDTSVSFVLVYGMKESAGNEYQGKSFTADVAILATQAPYETDGFDDADYDADAEYAYSASSAQEVADLFAQGKDVVINDAFNVTGPITLGNAADVSVDLNGKTITSNGDTTGDGVFKVNYASAQLTLNGSGTVDGDSKGSNDYNFAVWAVNGKIIVNDGYYTNATVTPNPEEPDSNHFDLIYASDGEIEINGGKFKCVTPAWTLNVKDDLDGKITVKGGMFYKFDPVKVAAATSHDDNNEATSTWYVGADEVIVPKGYVSVRCNEDGTPNAAGDWYKVIFNGPAAISDETELAEAFAVGGSIMIAQDMMLTQALTVTADLELSLGGTITLDVPANTRGSAQQYAIEVAEGRTLTITGDSGEIKMSDKGEDTATYCIRNRGTLVMKGVTVSNIATGKNAIHNYGAMSMEDCVVKAAYRGIYSYGETAVIESMVNCTVSVEGSGPDSAIYLSNSKIGRMEGCTITATTTGSLSVYAINMSGSKNTQAIENIEDSTFDGALTISGKGITVASGTFKNTGMTLSEFQKFVPSAIEEGSDSGIYVVTKVN